MTQQILMLLTKEMEDIIVDYSSKDGETGIKSFPNEFFEDQYDFIVLFFFPGDFTSICSTEIIAFNEQIEEFRSLGALPVACSINNPYVHNAWKNTPKTEAGLGTNISFPILSDTSNKLSKFFDVMHPQRGVAIRGLFVVNRYGRIVFESRSDTKTARNVSAVLDLIRDLKRLENTSNSNKRERTQSMQLEICLEVS